MIADIYFSCLFKFIIIITNMEESPKQKHQSPSHSPHTPQNVNSSPLKEIDSRWVELKCPGAFSPRSYFASCIQAGNIYVHGGFSAQMGIMKDLLTCCMYDEPVIWKTVTAKNSKTCNPGPLRNHTLSCYKSNLILIGGQKNVVDNNNQIYRYDLFSQSWSVCKCLSSEGKSFNFAFDSHCAIIHKSDIYLIGGYQAYSTVYSTKVIKISLEKVSEDQLTFQVISPEVGPSPRGNASCCLVNDQIYLFGGGKVEQVYNDLWIWSIQAKTWTEYQKKPQNITWPDKRKGATLIFHNQSGNLFLFGGIKTITKECNDVFVWMPNNKRWIKIHSNTNELYQPSPTVKQQLESPSISDQKRKRDKFKTHNGFATFKIGIKAVSKSDHHGKMSETNILFNKKQSSLTKIEGADTGHDFRKKMSVVQEKKYREFLNRKKKLLSNIQSGYDKTKERRTHSPTSEAIIFSLNAMGEQQRNQKSDFNLPKVIYNEDKGQLIGKKPCARDGHAALVHEENMIILGGDRHMVSFKDVYIFKLNKGVDSLPHYE